MKLINNGSKYGSLQGAVNPTLKTDTSTDIQDQSYTLTHLALNKPDQFQRRKHQKRQALLEKSHDQLENSKFWEKRALYTKPDE